MNKTFKTLKPKNTTVPVISLALCAVETWWDAWGYGLPASAVAATPQSTKSQQLASAFTNRLEDTWKF